MLVLHLSVLLCDTAEPAIASCSCAVPVLGKALCGTAEPAIASCSCAVPVLGLTKVCLCPSCLGDLEMRMG